MVEQAVALSVRTERYHKKINMKNKNTNTNTQNQVRMIRNSEIIKSLTLLRRDIKSKDYGARQDFLTRKNQALTQLGHYNQDARDRPSLIALRILDNLYPELKSKGNLTEDDWGEKKLMFRSVEVIPQRRDNKTSPIFKEVDLEAKRITDTRGIDNKITLKDSEDNPIRTPWYYIPNIVDFEI